MKRHHKTKLTVLNLLKVNMDFRKSSLAKFENPKSSLVGSQDYANESFVWELTVPHGLDIHVVRLKSSLA